MPRSSITLMDDHQKGDLSNYRNTKNRHHNKSYQSPYSRMNQRVNKIVYPHQAVL